MEKKIFSALAVTILLLFAGFCSVFAADVNTDAASTDTDQTQTVTEETESPAVETAAAPTLSGMSSVAVGQTIQLKVDNLPSGTAVVWSSSDDDIAAVDSQGIVTGKAEGNVKITAKVGTTTLEKDIFVYENAADQLKYSAHVQNTGWMSEVGNGKTAGTIGKGLRLEALKIRFDGIDPNQLGISYSANVEGEGWQSAYADKNGDMMIGTVGEAKRIEGVQISLTGEQAENYDIYYCVHVQNAGWLNWAKNGAKAGTESYDYRVEAIQIRILPKGSAAPAKLGSYDQAYYDVSALGDASITYQGHVQNIGWQDDVAANTDAYAGTTGRGYRLEALKIKLSEDNLLPGSGIQYSAHVQDEGWQSWRGNNSVAGTTGQSKRIEAVRIKLTGPVAQKYDIYYRVHIQNFGWLDWAKNGGNAGSTGINYRAEAVQIKIVPKGTNPNLTTTRPYINSDYLMSLISESYTAHLQNIGDVAYNPTADDQTIGTTNQGRRLEGVTAKLSGEFADGSSINYQTHVQDYGWNGWKSNGAYAGTRGQGKRVEAIQFTLSGKAASYYDIYYQAHVQNYGWLGWAKNGEWAGTTNGSLRLEAVRIKLVPKGRPAPGSTANHYIHIETKDYGWMPLSSTCICIDRTHQVLCGYIGGRKVVETPVITGKPSTPTPAGNYAIRSKSSPSVLVGANYRSYVTFWMPFIGNSIGIHDASWQ